MNIKQFYLIIACEKLPQEITEYIWKLVKDDAANTIARLYYKKVKINLNFFRYLLNLDILYSENILNMSNINTINNVISNNMYKITYKYIQEPGTWIEKLTDILYFSVPQYERRLYVINQRYINVNNIYYIIDNIKNNNEIYQNTGFEWWEHF